MTIQKTPQEIAEEIQNWFLFEMNPQIKWLITNCLRDRVTQAIQAERDFFCKRDVLAQMCVDGQKIFEEVKTRAELAERRVGELENHLERERQINDRLWRGLKLVGTDGCIDCEVGRVSMYVIDKGRCLECSRKALTPKDGEGKGEAEACSACNGTGGRPPCAGTHPFGAACGECWSWNIQKYPKCKKCGGSGK